MSSPEFEEVNVGDIVHTQILDDMEEAVVIGVHPVLHLGKLAIDDNEARTISMPFSWKGPVRVIGKMSIDETANSLAVKVEKLPDYRAVEGWKEVLIAQQDMGPVLHPKLDY